MEVIDVKAINYRLKLISKNDRSKISDDIERATLKSVKKSISKNETVTEVPVLNALKSIKKVSGITDSTLIKVI